jgi:hypothetical protein
VVGRGDLKPAITGRPAQASKRFANRQSASKETVSSCLFASDAIAVVHAAPSLGGFAKLLRRIIVSDRHVERTSFRFLHLPKNPCRCADHKPVRHNARRWQRPNRIAACLAKPNADPQALIPANRMPYAGMATAGDRADLIAYLQKATK